MRTLLACILCAVALAVAAESARAHGTITPPGASAGATQRFEIAVPNESINVVLNGFRLTPPEGATIESLEPGRGWSTSREGRTVVWSGAEVQAGDTAVFAFTARLPGSGATATFQGEEIYVGYERTGEFPLEVTLAGAGLTPSPAADDDASPWGAVATAVAVVGLLMLALVFLLVRVRRAGRASP